MDMIDRRASAANPRQARSLRAVAGARELGGDDDPIARHAFHPSTEDRLGKPMRFGRRRRRIELGTVEEVHARLVGLIEQSVCRGFIHLRPECHGPEREP